MSDLKVVPLARPTEQTSYVCETLKICLEQAERGEIEAFLLVATRRDGSVLRAHGRDEGADAFKLLGVLTHESRWLSDKIDAENATEDHLA